MNSEKGNYNPSINYSLNYDVVSDTNAHVIGTIAIETKLRWVSKCLKHVSRNDACWLPANICRQVLFVKIIFIALVIVRFFSSLMLPLFSFYVALHLYVILMLFSYLTRTPLSLASDLFCHLSAPVTWVYSIHTYSSCRISSRTILGISINV